MVFVTEATGQMGTSATINLVVIRHRLSPERLARYEAASADLTGAMQLYEWNMDTSAAFHGLLHGLEVVLRNALHEQMTARHSALGLPGTWFDDPLGILEAKSRRDIADARDRLLAQGKPINPSRLVSELTFGFWRYLLAARYERTLWTPALRHAFPNLRSRRRVDVARPVERLNHLRNRIAHYEPIYPRRLDLDQRDALDVVSAICGEWRAWLEQTSLVAGTLARRP
jgi:hypothetical protein